MREPINTPIDIAAAGINTLVAGQTGSRIAVLEYQLLNVLGAQDLQALDGTTPLTGVYAGFPAMAAIARISSGYPVWVLQRNSAFQLLTSVGTRVSGYVLWIPIPADQNPMEYILGASKVYLGPLSDAQKTKLVSVISGGW